MAEQNMKSSAIVRIAMDPMLQVRINTLADGTISITNTGNGFVWLSLDDARMVRDWLNANVK